MPADQFRSEAVGILPPGHTVRNEPLVVAVTVMFRTTAVAVRGTPAMPATVRVDVLPGPRCLVFFASFGVRCKSHDLTVQPTGVSRNTWGGRYRNVETAGT